MIERFSDAYEFMTDDYADFKNEVNSFEKDSEWIEGVRSSRLKINSFEPVETPILAASLGIDANVIFDTAENSKLYLKYGEDSYMVRDTAVKSLTETAKISGSALGRIPTFDLAEVLNRCLKAAKGDSIMLKRGDKVCACLSDSYKIMPISELINITEKVLTEKFGELKFVRGENNYTYTTALWELPEVQDELLDKYDASVKQHSRSLHEHNFMPAVRFLTSDIGMYAASLFPEFRMKNGAYVRINSGIKVEHKSGGGSDRLEVFESNAHTIFAKFCDLSKTMAAMANCCISYPLNALVGICKKASIPKRLASDAYEEIERFCAGGRSCYMDDIYLSIAGSVADAGMNGLSTQKQLALEESAAKILNYKWKDFDVAGVVTW